MLLSIWFGEQGPWLEVIDFIIVFAMSSSFGFLRDKLREHLIHKRQETLTSVVDALFEELMILGFISLMLALVSETGWSRKISDAVGLVTRDGKTDPLSASLHEIHLLLFFIMVMFIVQVLCLVWIGLRMAKLWKEWEDVGTSQDSSYRERREKLVVWQDKSKKRQVIRDNVSVSWRWPWCYRGMRGFLIWRAIQHEFLFPSWKAQHGGLHAIRDRVHVVKRPHCFPLHKYFVRRLSTLLENMVRVSFPTSLLCFLCAPMFVAVNDIGRQNQLILLTCLAWGLVVILYLFGVNVHGIHTHLCPRLPVDEDGLLVAFDELTCGFGHTRSRPDSQRSMSTARMRLRTMESMKTLESPAESSIGTPIFRLEGRTHRSLIKGGPRMITWFLEVFMFAQAILMSFLFFFYVNGQSAVEVVLLVCACMGIALNLLWLIPKITQAVVIILSIEHLKDKALIDAIELETREEREKIRRSLLRQARREIWARVQGRDVKVPKVASLDCQSSALTTALMSPTLPANDSGELHAAFAKYSKGGFVRQKYVESVLRCLDIMDTETLGTLKRLLAHCGTMLKVEDFEEALAGIDDDDRGESAAMNNALYEYLRCEDGVRVEGLEDKFRACGIVVPDDIMEESVLEAFGELKTYLTYDNFLVWCHFHGL